MGLSVRIIPVLLKKNNSLIKGRQFDSWRSVGHPLQAARIHASRGVDELMILDLGPDDPDYQMIDLLTKEAFIPITVGGGIKGISDIQNMLRAGADKVCIKSKEVIQEASKVFGKQAICACLEVRDQDVTEEAKHLEAIGAGEILLQTVERDGMMEGYDLENIYNVSHAVHIPIIASCGCGTYAHMLDAINAGASAVAAGAMFQWTDQTPLGAAKYLSAHGIETRT